MEVVVIFIALVALASAVLQIFLSLNKRKYLGWLLPALNFLASLAMQFNVYIHTVPDVPRAPHYELMLFVGQNLLTVFLLAEYFLLRWWKKRKEGIRRMHAQDIE